MASWCLEDVGPRPRYYNAQAAGRERGEDDREPSRVFDGLLLFGGPVVMDPVRGRLAVAKSGVRHFRVPLEPDHCHRDRRRHEAGLDDSALSRLQGVAVPILRERGRAISRKSHHRRPLVRPRVCLVWIDQDHGRIPQILDRPRAADCVVRLLRQVWLSDGQAELHRTGLLQPAAEGTGAPSWRPSWPRSFKTGNSSSVEVSAFPEPTQS